MSYQIPCHQFVYGKLIGIRKASYGLIASSKGIEERETFEIYKEFNGFRPNSADIETFSTSYAIRVFKKRQQLVFLRMARSDEKELGRNYFLQERYVVVNLSDLQTSNLTTWLWLLGIPAMPSSFTHYTDNLPNYLRVNKRELQEITNSAKNNLTKNLRFRNSILITLHHILDGLPIVFEIKEQKKRSLVWTWLAALGFLLPNRQISSSDFFWGKRLPINIYTSVNIVNEKVNNTKILSIALENALLEKQEFHAIHTSYTNLSSRCLETNDLQLINELTDIIETTPLPESPANPLDVYLWLSTMPDIGLKLARKTVDEKDDFFIDDIQWLWRHAFHNLTTSDLKRFLPILLEHTVDNWENLDFKSLRRVLEEKPRLLLQLKLGDAILVAFLGKWILHTNIFSTSETEHFIPLLIRLSKENPEDTINLLLKWVTKTEKSNLLEKTRDVIHNIQDTQLLDKYYWDIVLILKTQVTNKNQLSVFYDIIKKLTAFLERQHLLQFLNILLLGKNSFSTSTQQDIKNILLALSLSDGKSILPYLFFFSLHSNGCELANLAIAISQTDTLIGELSSDNEKEMIKDYYIHLTREKSNDHEFLASFFYILGELNLKDFVKKKMFLMLKTNTNLYKTVVLYMQKSLNCKRGIIETDYKLLNNINNQSEKFQLFCTYIVHTNTTPYTAQDIKILYDLLLNILSIDVLTFQDQQRLLDIFQKENHLPIFHRIIELQVRSAFLHKNQEKSKEKYKELAECVLSMKVKQRSSIWANSISKYFRKSKTEEKEDFLNWLLREPINTKPRIERNIAFIATSSVLKNNPEWFIHNPIIRLHLFREAFTIIYRHDI